MPACPPTSAACGRYGHAAGLPPSSPVGYTASRRSRLPAGGCRPGGHSGRGAAGVEAGVPGAAPRCCTVEWRTEKTRPFQGMAGNPSRGYQPPVDHPDWAGGALLQVPQGWLLGDSVLALKQERAGYTVVPRFYNPLF